MKKLFRRLTCGFCRKENIEYADFNPFYGGSAHNPSHTGILVISTDSGEELLFSFMNYCPVCGRKLRITGLLDRMASKFDYSNK